MAAGIARSEKLLVGHDWPLLALRCCRRWLNLTRGRLWGAMSTSAEVEAVRCFLLPAAASSAACQRVSYRAPLCSAAAEGTTLAAGVAAAGGGAVAGNINSESAGGTAGTPRSSKPQSKGFASVCKSPHRTLFSLPPYITLCTIVYVLV